MGSWASVYGADHADTRNMCEGSVHESAGAHMWSWSTKWSAYAR